MHHFQEDDEDEHFVDIPDENTNNELNNNNETNEDNDMSQGDAEEKTAPKKPALQQEANTNSYRPKDRNPLYCGAEHSCLWELVRLSHHYHPSVCHFARTLIKVRYLMFCQ